MEQSDKIYIVISVDKKTSIAEIINSTTSELVANVNFLVAVDNFSKNDNCTCSILSKSLAVISKKNIGYISSSTDIIKIIQLVEFDNPSLPPQEE